MPCSSSASSRYRPFLQPAVASTSCGARAASGIFFAPAALIFGASGLLALGLMLLSPLSMAAGISFLRILLAPVAGLGFLLGGIFAPTKQRRPALLGATALEIAAFGGWLASCLLNASTWPSLRALGVVQPPVTASSAQRTERTTSLPRLLNHRIRVVIVDRLEVLRLHAYAHDVLVRIRA